MQETKEEDKQELSKINRFSTVYPDVCIAKNNFNIPIQSPSGLEVSPGDYCASTIVPVINQRIKDKYEIVFVPIVSIFSPLNKDNDEERIQKNKGHFFKECFKLSQLFDVESSKNVTNINLFICEVYELYQINEIFYELYRGIYGKKQKLLSIINSTYRDIYRDRGNPIKINL